MGEPDYCPFYCEENVWRQCAPDPAAGPRSALFISNPARRVALWGQRLAPMPELPVVWDYHVVLLLHRVAATGEQIWDLDARASQPEPALGWLRRSFSGTGLLAPEFCPRFRLVPASDYHRELRSDRRHMRDSGGLTRHAPPPWPSIQGHKQDPPQHNLERFIDTEDLHFPGECLSLPQLRRRLAR